MPRDVRARQNMYFFREANERIQQPGGDWRSAQRLVFVCECSNLGCRAPVYLTLEEFRLVRETPGQFIVVPDHIHPIDERVVALTSSHAVVTSVDVDEALMTEVRIVER